MGKKYMPVPESTLPSQIIIDIHKGIISAKSELNEGARFDIYLPA